MPSSWTPLPLPFSGTPSNRSNRSVCVSIASNLVNGTHAKLPLNLNRLNGIHSAETPRRADHQSALSVMITPAGILGTQISGLPAVCTQPRALTDSLKKLKPPKSPTVHVFEFTNLYPRSRVA